MRTTSLASLLAAMATLAAGVEAQDCAKNLHIMVARGTGEEEGPGATGSLARRIARQIGDSDISALDYPATALIPTYFDSVREGDDAMSKALRDYAKECPDTKIALMGYSQGAHVIMDVLCGGSGDLFSTQEAMPLSFIKKSVVAITLFGDPTHVANTTYDLGTAINDGVFSRRNISACEDLSDRLVSYCDTGDIFCDSGNDVRIHGAYIDTYGDQVAKFVVDRYDNATDSDSGGVASSSTASPSSSTRSPSSSTGSPSSSTGSPSSSTDSPSRSTDSPSSTGLGFPTQTGEDGGSVSETGSSDGSDGSGSLAPGLAPELGLLGLAGVAVLGLTQL